MNDRSLRVDHIETSFPDSFSDHKTNERKKSESNVNAWHKSLGNFMESRLGKKKSFWLFLVRSCQDGLEKACERGKAKKLFISNLFMLNFRGDSGKGERNNIHSNGLDNNVFLSLTFMIKSRSDDQRLEGLKILGNVNLFSQFSNSYWANTNLFRSMLDLISYFLV